MGEKNHKDPGYEDPDLQSPAGAGRPPDDPGPFPRDFHPLLREWFTLRYPRPTEIQDLAWESISRGEHCLLTAPTGSGKTLAAFLAGLNSLITRQWDTAGQALRILYVSPLKALNSDVYVNLLRPLEELKDFFASRGEDFPSIRVGLRSGDTSPAERQQMLRHPPDILITTPESLNFLLSSPRGSASLGDIRVVILDEIHNLISEKRGTYLITAVERLARLAGEFQRIGLSATINPMELAADFLGGSQFIGAGNTGGPVPDGIYRRRPVEILRAAAEKRYDLEIRTPGTAAALQETPPSGDLWWELLKDALTGEIESAGTSLIFGNSRRLVEKTTRLLNEDREEKLAWSHHGSLSREIRQTVEKKFKAGELRAIVATNSLELGIDIGDLDQVILVQAPDSLASAVQRVGRSGHGVDQTSRGIFYPLHSGDLLPLAVCAREILKGSIEEVRSPESPLDVLAQVILSMALTETWNTGELYAFLRQAHPYRNLSRDHFDMVIRMLAGRYADSRVRELSPRIYYDPVSETVSAREGQSLVYFMSGGMIPDRGYYTLRMRETGGKSPGAKIGELDEEFVWERQIGDHFVLGTQAWEIVDIGDRDVLVVPGKSGFAMPPFWKGDSRGRSFLFSEKIGLLLEKLDGLGGDEGLKLLQTEYPMAPEAAEDLLAYLERQKAHTRAPLPHRRRLILEISLDPDAPEHQNKIFIHNFWGGRVNRPLGILLAQYYEEKTGFKMEVFHDDNCLLMALPEPADPQTLLEGLSREAILPLLEKKLEQTPFFGARFRENAGRALLLPRKGFHSRTPLWFNRERSKKILSAVKSYQDFPITLETWRTSLKDEFDLESLELLLGEIRDNKTSLVKCYTRTPSPFTSGNLWYQVNDLMYRDDSPQGSFKTGLASNLIRDILDNQDLRPRIPPAVIRSFEDRMARILPGYAPESPRGLLELLQERMVIPRAEWETLKEAIIRDAGERRKLRPEDSEDRNVPPAESVIAGMEERLVPLAFVSGESGPAGSPPGSTAGGPDSAEDRGFLCLRENLPRIQDARRAALEDRDYEDLSLITGEILRFYGPKETGFLGKLWALPPEKLEDFLETLEDQERIVLGILSEREENPEGQEGPEEGPPEFCDRENLEILLRMYRKSLRPEFAPLPAESLPLFRAIRGGLSRQSGPAVPPNRGQMESPEAPRSREEISCTQEQVSFTQEQVSRTRDTGFRLGEILDSFIGLSARFELWESDILPARLADYRISQLDNLIAESGLACAGEAGGKSKFFLPEDLFLMDPPETDMPLELEALFPRPGEYRDFQSLKDQWPGTTEDLIKALWEGFFAGRLGNTSYSALRKGSLNNWKLDPPRQEEPRRGDISPAARNLGLGPGGRRRGFARWEGGLPKTGLWYRIAYPPAPKEPEDPLERDDLQRERIAILLRRHGLLCRPLLQGEASGWTWSEILPTLRLMELSGEILGGYFFSGLPGPQFLSHEAFRGLEALRPCRAEPGQAEPGQAGPGQDGHPGGEPKDIYWMNAQDPASLCGLGLGEIFPYLPRRLPGNHLVFRGREPALISSGQGKDLRFFTDPEDPDNPGLLAFFKILLRRDFAPLKRIQTETINGEAFGQSPYLPALEAAGFLRGPKGMILLA